MDPLYSSEYRSWPSGPPAVAAQVRLCLVVLPMVTEASGTLTDFPLFFEGLEMISAKHVHFPRLCTCIHVRRTLSGYVEFSPGNVPVLNEL